jgi:hypothetical protein
LTKRERLDMNAIKEKGIFSIMPGATSRPLSKRTAAASVFRAGKNERDAERFDPAADGAREAERFGSALRQRIAKLPKR